MRNKYQHAIQSVLYDREWDTSTLQPFQLVDGTLADIFLSGLYPILYSWSATSQPSHRSSELALSSLPHSWQCCSSCIMPSVATVLATDGSVMRVNMHKLYCRTSTSSFLFVVLGLDFLHQAWMNMEGSMHISYFQLTLLEVTTVVRSFSIYCWR